MFVVSTYEMPWDRVKFPPLKDLLGTLVYIFKCHILYPIHVEGYDIGEFLAAGFSGKLGYQRVVQGRIHSYPVTVHRYFSPNMIACIPYIACSKSGGNQHPSKDDSPFPT